MSFYDYRDVHIVIPSKDINKAIYWPKDFEPPSTGDEFLFEETQYTITSRIWETIRGEGNNDQIFTALVQLILEEIE